MKNKNKVIPISITIIILSTFVACNSNKKSPEQTDVSETTLTITESKITAITDKNTSRNITQPANATTKSNCKNTTYKDSNSTTIKKFKDYKMKDEIIYFYNSAANNVKVNAKVAKINNQEIAMLQDYNPTGIFANTIKSNFNKADQLKNLECNNKELIKKYFPIAEHTYSSKLRPEMVDRASCYYDKGNYFIEIHLKNDPKGTQDYSKTCLSVVSPSYIEKNAGLSIVKAKNIKSTCKDCIIKATIDEKTGNLISFYYYMPTYLSIKVLGTYNDFAFYVIQDWSISY